MHLAIGWHFGQSPEGGKRQTLWDIQISYKSKSEPYEKAAHWHSSLASPPQDSPTGIPVSQITTHHNEAGHSSCRRRSENANKNSIRTIESNHSSLRHRARRLVICHHQHGPVQLLPAGAKPVVVVSLIVAVNLWSNIVAHVATLACPPAHHLQGIFNLMVQSQESPSVRRLCNLASHAYLPTCGCLFKSIIVINGNQNNKNNNNR